MTPIHPPSLRTLQSSLRSALSESLHIPRWMAGLGLLTPQRQVLIYRRSYRIRMQVAFARAFPAVRRVLGRARFRLLVIDYLKAHPSRSFTLADVGEQFPTFLRRQSWPPDQLFVPSLAYLERLIVESTRAEFVPPADLAWLREVPADRWPGARLILHPSVRLFYSEWAVDNLWSSRGKRDRPAVHQYPIWLLIASVGGRLTLQRLASTFWNVLRQIQAGVYLGSLSQKLDHQITAHRQEDVIHHWFADWIREGIVCRVEFPQQQPLPSGRNVAA